MKYLCLVYADENVVHTIPDAECVGYDQGIRESGECVASEALEPAASAKTVRIRDGKRLVTDGPFAETKEQLGGFYMVEAETMEEAIEIAAKIPPARVGSIEVRPIRPIRELVSAQAGAVRTSA